MDRMRRTRSDTVNWVVVGVLLAVIVGCLVYVLTKKSDDAPDNSGATAHGGAPSLKSGSSQKLEKSGHEPALQKQPVSQELEGASDSAGGSAETPRHPSKSPSLFDRITNHPAWVIVALIALHLFLLGRLLWRMRQLHTELGDALNSVGRAKRKAKTLRGRHA